MQITSNIRRTHKWSHPPGVEIKNEPMLFNCDKSHAVQLGGELTRSFIAHLPGEWADVPLVIDSRVHILMPGWYPCIPGWHHDDVPRTRADGQPNYSTGQDRSAHIIGLVNAHLAPTKFALGCANFSDPAGLNRVYETWHREVEDHVRTGALAEYEASDSQLIEFDDRTFHKGVPAVSTGWRFFIRASRYYDAAGGVIDRRNVRTNEVRRQVQIYLSAENSGW